jgi:hypothetical protein
VGQARAQVREPLWTEQQLPHDQQRPALANEVERAGDPAAIAVFAPVGHALQELIGLIRLSAYLVVFSNSLLGSTDQSLDEADRTRRRK